MLNRAGSVAVVAFVGVIVFGASVAAAAEERATQGKGMAAMERAAAAEKYVFIFFHKMNDPQTQAMRPVFDAFKTKVGERAEFVVVDTKDVSERDIVTKFDAKRSPMPLVMAIAPNGAVTGGFPLKFTEELLMGAFVSPSTSACLKALQDGKMILLCVQNETTKYAKESMQAAGAVKSDPKYGKTVEIVIVDPADAAEARAMKRLKIDPKQVEAITVLMAPPGTINSRIQGAASKKSLVAAVQAAQAKAKGGCCPGGKCGPKKPAGKTKAKSLKRKQ